MSSRAYNFRVRNEAGRTNQPRITVVASGRHNPPVAPTEDRLDVPVTAQNTEPTIPLYSDVAASRPPSPRKESEADKARETTSSRSEGVAMMNSNNTLPKLLETTSSYEGETPEREEDDGQWTTVRRRRARSLSSLDVRNNKKQNE